MKLAAVLVTIAIATSIGCGSDAVKSYPTYQMCFDDETMAKAQPVQMAIVMCCLDHPINAISPACGDTKPDCINYLTSNLNQTSASTTEVMDSCADYISQKHAMGL